MARPGHRRPVSAGAIRLASGACLAIAGAGCAFAQPSQPAPVEGKAACEPEGAECGVLLGVTIDGARAFSSAELAHAYEPYLAKRAGLAELTVIASAITKQYLDQGYFLSQAMVPPQDLTTGIARIVVIEGRISEVEVTGEGAAQVAPYIASLDQQSIANLKDIDRRLALASDAPGVSIRSSIEAFPEDPALHRLVVMTEFKPAEGQLFIDNRGTEAVGPAQVYGRFSLNSVFASRDQLGVSAYTTPEDPSELTQLAGSYRYLFGERSEIGGSFLQSESDGGFNADAPNIGANSQVGAIWYSRTLERSRSRSIWAGATFEAGHFESEWINGGGYEDEVRVGRVMLRGRQNDAGKSTNVLLRVSAGIDALGASRESIFSRSRYDADGSFTKLDFDASHYRDIGRYFGVYAAMGGQWSADPLLLSEEFTAGGTRYGRAYSYGEISGDHGLGGLVEFRAGLDPGLDPISFLQGYAFYDVAQVWNYNTPAGAEDLKLETAGLGLRVDFQEWLTARVETAKPLSRTPFDADDRDWRQFFSLSAVY